MMLPVWMMVIYLIILSLTAVGVIISLFRIGILSGEYLLLRGGMRAMGQEILNLQNVIVSIAGKLDAAAVRINALHDAQIAAISPADVAAATAALEALGPKIDALAGA